MAGRQSAAPGGRKSDINRKQSVNQAPGGKAQKSDEKFPPPDIESLQLDDDFLFRSALQNDFATICGAFDAKEHPLALYLAEKSLFNKRNEFGKTVFDLAAKLGHRDFIRTILDRTNDKIDELVFSLRTQLKQKSVPYNFMHYACIWNRYDLVKYLAEHPKLIIDPNLDSSTEIAALTMAAAGGGNKNQQQLLASNPYAKTLGSILLKSKAKTGERPLDLAKRYNYNDLVVYLDYAELRQRFIDFVASFKQITSDSERSSKLTKDEKKRLEKIYTETLDWINFFRDVDRKTLESKIIEVEQEVDPLIEKTRNLEPTGLASEQLPPPPKRSIIYEDGEN